MVFPIFRRIDRHDSESRIDPAPVYICSLTSVLLLWERPTVADPERPTVADPERPNWPIRKYLFVFRNPVRVTSIRPFVFNSSMYRRTLRSPIPSTPAMYFCPGQATFSPFWRVKRTAKTFRASSESAWFAIISFGMAQNPVVSFIPLPNQDCIVFRLLAYGILDKQ